MEIESAAYTPPPRSRRTIVGLDQRGVRNRLTSFPPPRQEIERLAIANQEKRSATWVSPLKSNPR